MAITLAEAKAALSTYVDNGVYPTDDRVIARINEAQRRLYAYRSWLGVLAKFSVQVSSSSPYTFSLPDYTGGALTTFGDFGLATLMQVTESDIAPGFLTNSEQAFLSAGKNLLKVDRVPGSSDFRQYQIVSTTFAPSIVEVTGKLQFQPATLSTDLLIIQDLDALRLMLLALWREQNGQLELAQNFEQKALERLSTILDKTLEGARRLNYQSMLATSTEGTMGWTRARLALDLKDGLHTDDSALFHLVDRAEEYLLTRGSWYGSIKQYQVEIPQSGELYLPHDVESVLFAQYGATRVNVFSREYDFHENGPGYRTADTLMNLPVLIDRGEDAIFDETVGDIVARRKIFVNKPTDCGKYEEVTTCSIPGFLVSNATTSFYNVRFSLDGELNGKTFYRGLVSSETFSGTQAVLGGGAGVTAAGYAGNYDIVAFYNGKYKYKKVDTGLFYKFIRWNSTNNYWELGYYDSNSVETVVYVSAVGNTLNPWSSDWSAVVIGGTILTVVAGGSSSFTVTHNPYCRWNPVTGTWAFGDATIPPTASLSSDAFYSSVGDTQYPWLSTWASLGATLTPDTQTCVTETITITPCMLTILGSARHSAKTSDSDPMVIGNYPALFEMVTAFMQSEKPDFFTFHENKAIQLLRDELQQKRGGGRMTMQVQGTAWAMGEIGNLR
jgi:hypothetical protein